MADGELKIFSDWANKLAATAWPEEAEREPRSVANDLFSKLLEEGGECVKQAHKFYGRSMHPDDDGLGDHLKLTDECGDVGVVWLRICAHLGVDPAHALTSALTKFEKRVDMTLRLRHLTHRNQ